VSGLSIQILGTRGNIKPTSRRHARHSGVLVGGELLLDCGEDSFARLRPRWTLITHFHPDHAFFVENPSRVPPRVFAPELHPHCRARVVRPGETLRLGRWRVTAVPIIHSDRVRSLAYRVERNGRALVYTGDVASVPRAALRLMKESDLIITEGSFLRRGGLLRKDPRTGRKYGHAGLPDLISWFAPLAPRILIVHLGSWFYRNPREAGIRIRALGRESGVRIRVAWDGMRLDP
jgi:phosphoribosyl 1,2-cyclic phosphodiesterase